jgi:NAD(P)-dependent dehydrogenase (short-subunit alcohol dehydrogenase family)
VESLAGKVAVVTGGASGIGFGMALNFARAGAKVVIADVEIEAAHASAERLREGGAEVLAIATDVTNPASLEVLAERTFADLGAAHVICNNAGVCVESSIAEGSDADWRWMLDVNLEGIRNGVRAFVPRLRRQGQGGHIVNTASLSGLLPAGFLGIYTTTKFAVVGLTESLRQELAPEGIGVSLLLPAAAKTNLGSSQRNRPERLGSNSAAMQSLAATLEAGQDPIEIGELVVAGILANEPYIFPDGSLVEVLRAQLTGMVDAMERAR